MYEHMETGDRTLRLYRVFIIGLIDNESTVGDYGIEMSRRGPTKREMESYRRCDKTESGRVHNWNNREVRGEAEPFWRQFRGSGHGRDTENEVLSAD